MFHSKGNYTFFFFFEQHTITLKYIIVNAGEHTS